MAPLAGARWFSPVRLAGLAVTGALFILVFQRIEGAVLLETFVRIKVFWLGLALVLYGLAIGLAGLRWHLALRLTGCPVHVAASCRLTCIGHFFFIILFGGAGGDIAKSLLYARWYRLGFPETLAAAPLDRGLGTAASLTIATLAVCLAFFTGGLRPWHPVAWALPRGWWLLAAALAVALCVPLWIRRPQWISFWVRGWGAFRAGVRRMFDVPELGWKAMGLALAHQVSVQAVFAFSLGAVSRQPVPWLELSWTIPAINILSCFPLTFAGAGVREVASVTLLGLYDVPAGDAVAAAMAALVVRLLWAGAGGALFWREQSAQTRDAHRSVPRTISVVIPTFNEAVALGRLIPKLKTEPEICEVIVADGGSVDATVSVARELGCRVFRTRRSRGAQLGLGAAQAKGDAVWLVHADTWPPPRAGRAMLDCLQDATVVAGGFWKVFEHPPLMLLGSRFKCAMRLWFWRRIAGDQAMFVRRDVLEAVGGVPDVPLMEEFELCRRLRAVGRLALAGAKVQTSARRFRQFGVLRTYLLMGRIHALYRAGVPLETLRRLYEKESNPIHRAKR